MYGLKESIRERDNADCAQQAAKKAQRRYEVLAEIGGAIITSVIIAVLTVAFIMVASA